MLMGFNKSVYKKYTAGFQMFLKFKKSATKHNLHIPRLTDEYLLGVRLWTKGGVIEDWWWYKDKYIETREPTHKKLFPGVKCKSGPEKEAEGPWLAKGGAGKTWRTFL